MAKSKSTASTSRSPGRGKSVNPIASLYSRLPFIADGARGRNFWALPAKGGYAGGCQAGTFAAVAFLKFLREKQKISPGFDYGTLQCVVLDMLLDRNGPKNDATRGQVVGFFSELERALNLYINLMDGLDQVSFDSLAAQMNRGLARTKADDRADLRRINSDVARRGWETRRRNHRTAERMEA